MLLATYYLPLITAYIGLGSNIEPETNLAACAEMLRADYPGIIFSSVYKTAARDEEHQADFLNAVAKMETDETPDEIQATLKAIEDFLGKNPPYPKGPRTIDLDVLLYDDLVSPQEDTNDKLWALSAKLAIPHPRMCERRFVLEPLLELIDPLGVHPCSGKSWNGLLEQVKGQKCESIILKL